MLRLSDALANECGKLFLWGNYWGMFEANSQSHLTTLAKSIHERSLVGGGRSTIVVSGSNPPRLRASPYGDSKIPARRCLPGRKRSTDIIDRCAEYTEREAAANQGEQHGRFHAVDVLLVNMKLVGESGHHGTSLGSPPFRHQVSL
jgi:hypothetical protein